jgi:hypothetical protein
MCLTPAKGRENNIKNVWNPKLNIYYVAAKETQAGLLTRIMAYGAITVERTWRSKGKDVINKRRKPE